MVNTPRVCAGRRDTKTHLCTVVEVGVPLADEVLVVALVLCLGRGRWYQLTCLVRKHAEGMGLTLERMTSFRRSFSLS